MLIETAVFFAALSLWIGAGFGSYIHYILTQDVLFAILNYCLFVIPSLVAYPILYRKFLHRKDLRI